MVKYCLYHPRRYQYRQQYHHESPYRDQKRLSLFRCHVGYVVAGQEEGDVGGDEDRQDTPPLVDPDEGMVAGAREEGFKEGKEQGHFDRADQLAADAFAAVFGEVALAAVLGEHLKGDDAGQGEHH